MALDERVAKWLNYNADASGDQAGRMRHSARVEVTGVARACREESQVRKPYGLFILETTTFPLIYGPPEIRDIAERVDLIGPQMTRDAVASRSDLLRRAEIIFSGWGAPLMDDAFLARAPNLKAVFYAAGAVGSWMTQSVWDRGVRVTSAYAANARPVAEYTLAMIVLGLKQAWMLSRQSRDARTFVPRDGAPGCYGSTVGIISLGAIGRRVRDLLRMLEVNVIVYDPYLTEQQATSLGVERVTLPQLFRISDVVTLHAPDIEDTCGMITGAMLDSMKPGATFINTARGRLVVESEMIEVLRRRPDLQVILDVCEPEPPAADSVLFDLPNVFLTPHIAGSAGMECRRMGRYMVDELDRYLQGLPLRWEITPELAARTCHRPLAATVQKSVRQPVAV
jgi:phosphoglycerate dehydrogenase-like enzyme